MSSAKRSLRVAGFDAVEERRAAGKAERKSVGRVYMIEVSRKVVHGVEYIRI